MNKQIAKVDRVKAGSISQFIDRHFVTSTRQCSKTLPTPISRILRRGENDDYARWGNEHCRIGISLAEMIRQDKVHAITCTGANLEEDLFNLVARSHYERIPHYRELTAQQEKSSWRRHLNRVTDTCIPEEEAIRRIEKVVMDAWVSRLAEKGANFFPHEFFYKILRECRLKKFYEIDPADSWMIAAAHKDLPIFCSWLGRFDIGEHLRRALHDRRDQPMCILFALASNI